MTRSARFVSQVELFGLIGVKKKSLGCCQVSVRHTQKINLSVFKEFVNQWGLVVEKAHIEQSTFETVCGTRTWTRKLECYDH